MLLVTAKWRTYFHVSTLSVKLVSVEVEDNYFHIHCNAYTPTPTQLPAVNVM